jgi:hypothetical protein
MLIKLASRTPVATARGAGRVWYDCSFPSAESSLRRIQEPLPFPSTLTETLAWAAAFIDQSGHFSKDLENVSLVC